MRRRNITGRVIHTSNDIVKRTASLVNRRKRRAGQLPPQRVRRLALGTEIGQDDSSWQEEREESEAEEADDGRSRHSLPWKERMRRLNKAWEDKRPALVSAIQSNFDRHRTYRSAERAELVGGSLPTT